MKYWHGTARLCTGPGTIPVVLLLALGAAPNAGCVSEQLGSSTPEQGGSLASVLEVAPSLAPTSISYSITKGAFTKAGSVDVGDSPDGSLAVNATLNVAPVVNELTATARTVFVGAPVTLTGAAADPDDGPSPLSY